MAYDKTTGKVSGVEVRLLLDPAWRKRQGLPPLKPGKKGKTK